MFIFIIILDQIDYVPEMKLKLKKDIEKEREKKQTKFQNQTRIEINKQRNKFEK